MARQGGRQKGTPNKDKQVLRDLIEARWPGWHPVVAMANVANDETKPDDLRFQCAKEVAQYIEPKRKALEVDASVELTGDLLWQVKLVGNKKD